MTGPTRSRAGRSVRRTVGLALVAALVSALLISCTGSDSEAPATAGLGSEPAGGDGWRVATQAGLETSVADVDPASVGGRLPAGVARLGDPVRIEVVDGTISPDGLLLRRTLRSPVPPGRAALLGYLDVRSGRWIPVRTSLSPDRTALTARVHHLSLWDVLTVPVSDLVRPRVDAPSCAGELPDWAERVEFFDDVDAPVRWCAGADPNNPDVLVVKVAANRGYGFTVRPNVGPAWAWSSAADQAGPVDIFTWGLTAAGQLPTVLADLLDGVALMPPGTEVHLGFTERQVRNLPPGPLVSVEADLGYAVSGYAYEALTRYAGHQSASAALLVSLVAVFQCVVDLENAGWARFAPTLLNCVVWGWEEVQQLIVSIGLRLGMNAEEVGKLAARVSGILLAVAALQSGFVIGDYIFDQWQLPPAEARVTLAMLLPTVSPGRVGVLRAGMAVDAAIATTWVFQHPPKLCTIGYSLRRPYRDWMWAFFHDGDPPTLQVLTIDSRSLRTREGHGVGTAVDVLRDTYGSRLVDLGVNRDYGGLEYVVYERAGYLLFSELDGDGRIDVMQVGPETSPSDTVGLFYEGC